MKQLLHLAIMTIVRQAQNDVDNNTFKLAPINKKVKKNWFRKRKKKATLSSWGERLLLR